MYAELLFELRKHHMDTWLAWYSYAAWDMAVKVNWKHQVIPDQGDLIIFDMSHKSYESHGKYLVLTLYNKFAKFAIIWL